MFGDKRKGGRSRRASKEKNSKRNGHRANWLLRSALGARKNRVRRLWRPFSCFISAFEGQKRAFRIRDTQATGGVLCVASFRPHKGGIWTSRDRTVSVQRQESRHITNLQGEIYREAARTSSRSRTRKERTVRVIDEGPESEGVLFFKRVEPFLTFLSPFIDYQNPFLAEISPP
jgi:hypothetical protein